MVNLVKSFPYVRDLKKKMFWTKKEVKYLLKILKPDEMVLDLASGVMGGNSWLVACTNTRIIFLDKGFLFGAKQIEIPLEKINSISHEIGFVFGELYIWDGSSKTEIKNINKKFIKEFVDNINKALHNIRVNANGNSSQSSQNGSRVESYNELEKLYDLKNKGIITEEEFNAEKRKLLG